MSVSPQNVRALLVVVFPEQNAEQRLYDERVVLIGNMNER